MLVVRSTTSSRTSSRLQPLFAVHAFDTDTLRLICISDTHNDDCRSHVPDGDILLHAGDMTDFGTLEEFQAAVDWIISLPHPVKVVVAGR